MQNVSPILCLVLLLLHHQGSHTTLQQRLTATAADCYRLWMDWSGPSLRGGSKNEAVNLLNHISLAIDW